MPNSIAVFCGSREGASPVYMESAYALGREMANRGITLVYGGSRVGLMGAVANAVLEGGGQAIGVLPHFMQAREIAHPGLTELIMVDSMHERKAKMAELAEGFVTLPGGSGTMEEYFEIFTWAQLGLHSKPTGVLNAGGYYDPLIALFDRMTGEGFVTPQHRKMMLTAEQPGELLDLLDSYRIPDVPQILTEERT
ncbi:LOG family protein [Saccharibacillus kuerlensis]|uniref:Cytokinin riboside 5'-monophosphate phosphoribohydrolase n=1 Tax=Saccharibacillus kuerlensis TaxID=459527 RepID=A0ABQ2KWA6_9BACL|nr:TIGR00730 family Rossman fold protein [Saccharibacillus kuerlensis]GGN93510.1 putative cytokinin riboside 5'-monophosphate phosphoribohydrolase [Saccharibacillus kuerlensis]